MNDVRVAYITAEIATADAVPTFSGGLGALSGDSIRTAADLGLPMAFFGIMAHKGYGRQVIVNGKPQTLPQDWDPKSQGYELLPVAVTVNISGRPVKVQPWLKMFSGREGEVPLYLLDTDVGGNTDWDRRLSDWLYDQNHIDKEYIRLCQDTILGMGSVKMARALGYTGIETFHLNDAHGALAAYEVLKENMGDVELTRKQFFFTTHTPVQAAFDSFSRSTVENVLGEQIWNEINGYGSFGGKFNNACFALNMSRGVNAVSKRHAEVCRQMGIFKGHRIFPITNGVYAPTWVSPELGDAYTRHLGNWEEFPELFEEADRVPIDAILEAREYSEQRLISRVKEGTGIEFEPGIPIVSFGRRATTYKRGDLLFHDMNNLVASAKGKYQLVFAMKAHPNDTNGQDLIARVITGLHELREKGVNAVFLDDYSLAKATDMIQASFLWVNNPERPLEASGTSGMKVSPNGGLNFSVLDGWWAEGYRGLNGFAIAPANICNDPAADAAAMYHLLRNDVQDVLADKELLTVFTHNSLKLAAYYNTKRMMLDYAKKAWNIDVDEKRKIAVSRNGHNGRKPESIALASGKD